MATWIIPKRKRNTVGVVAAQRSYDRQRPDLKSSGGAFAIV
jgi:hypothetical protein